MVKLMNIWSKHSDYLQSNSKSPKFSRYNLTTAHNGRTGRPSYEIAVEQVKLLRGYYFEWESIAKIFDIHRTTLWRRIKDCDFSAESNVSVSNEELDDFFFFSFFFINCYLAVPRPTLAHTRGDSLTNPMLITAFFCTYSTRRSPGAS